MNFTDACMDSSLEFAFHITPWQERSRIIIRSSRFIMSEKILISCLFKLRFFSPILDEFGSQIVCFF